MYNVSYFRAKNNKEVIEFIKSNPFIVLCGVDKNNAPVATHIPVLIEERGTDLFLVGHIMKETDHHKAFEYNKNVLAIFNGPHSYVSASWYTNPQQASTWNYLTAHAKGKMKFLDDQSLLVILQRTTAYFENNVNSPSLYEKLAEDYITRLSKAIVAFEIKVTEIEHVFKLSQNKDEKSFDNIISHLQSKEGEEKSIAEQMKKRRGEIFGL
jgi:transcriptional regulator